LNLAGQLPFKEARERLSGRNLELLRELIYREFNNFW
jgi:hypothetical protein